jgi:hypothetical protein
MPDLELLHIFGEDLPPNRGWELLDWCHASGADEFTIYAIESGEHPEIVFEPFDLAVSAFKRPPAPRRRLSWRPDEEPVAETELWALTPETLAAIHYAFPRGPFDYYPTDGWFEDLWVYRAGELMLGIITHEQEGVLRVTQQEKHELKRLGFPFRDTSRYVGY